MRPHRTAPPTGSAAHAEIVKERPELEITIYHNPDCGTSRNALAAIRAAGHEPRIFEYLKAPISRGAISALAGVMDVPVRGLIRSKEPLFRELGLDHEDVTDSELLDAMAAHPILINRPIVVVKNEGKITARLCRPSDAVKALLARAGANA
jgi:arsenate reductase (glutaredoxin)